MKTNDILTKKAVNRWHEIILEGLDKIFMAEDMVKWLCQKTNTTFHDSDVKWSIVSLPNSAKRKFLKI